ncbi:MAG: hypothetical protein BGO31_12045 [Bacteroidetes bacterium 43-16]|nr:MAG: hypothetical protein BGO31_12045 [Bacteroidetes bacterium 43-16]
MNTATTEIRIQTFKPEYAEAFRALNVAWISSFFEMEESDYKALNHPQEYILDKGGEIFVALSGTAVIGVCAMIRINEQVYELAKMAVSEQAQGRGAGRQLGIAAIEWARQQGAARIILDSNRKLDAALHLYHKLGFKEVARQVDSPYQRADIQMVLDLV